MLSKSCAYDEEIEEEENFAMKIKSVAPAKFSAGRNVKAMKESIDRCMSCLTMFYCGGAETTSSCHSIAKLWSDIKGSMKSIPNVFVFQLLAKQIGAHNDHLSRLTASMSKMGTLRVSSQKLIPKLKHILAGSAVECLSKKGQFHLVKSVCGESIQNVTNELEGTMMSVQYSSPCDDDDAVGDFVSALLMKVMLQGKIKFSSEIITGLKHQSTTRMEEYTEAIHEIRKMYKLIDSKILVTQENITQIYEINEKAKFTKISMVRLLQDLKSSIKYQKMNCSMMNLNKTTSEKLPRHLVEVKTCLAIPLKTFCRNTNMVAYELNANHLQGDDDAIAVFKMLISRNAVKVGDLLGSMRKQFEICQNLQEVFIHPETQIALQPFTSIQVLNKQRNTNREIIIEQLDQISMTNIATKSSLRDVHVLYKYSMSNPFKKFVAPTKKFEKKSFKEYENDFNLYYKMIKD